MRALWAVVVAVSATTAAFAQAPPYAPPRNADGKPDLGGVWSNSDVEAIFSQTVNGKVQTAPLRDPLDRKLPFRDSAAAMAWRNRYGAYMSGKPQPDFTRGADTLPNRDRCLMAANAAAPPMTSQGYNDAYQIVQTPSVVVISVEMMDETRIIPVVASAAEAGHAHGPQVLQRWTGDSVGWWEGDTFVVETVNVNVKQGRESPFPTSKDAKAVERFTRAADGGLHYQAEVTDPATYTRPWKVEYSFHPAERLWEYACHEGNYDVAGILSTIRQAEREKEKRK